MFARVRMRNPISHIASNARVWSITKITIWHGAEDRIHIEGVSSRPLALFLFNFFFQNGHKNDRGRMIGSIIGNVAMSSIPHLMHTFSLQETCVRSRQSVRSFLVLAIWPFFWHVQYGHPYGSIPDTAGTSSTDCGPSEAGHETARVASLDP